jgi:hypothetical protein
MRTTLTGYSSAGFLHIRIHYLSAISAAQSIGFGVSPDNFGFSTALCQSLEHNMFPVQGVSSSLSHSVVVESLGYTESCLHTDVRRSSDLHP